MQAFITNLLVALACGSMVQAAPAIDARQAVVTSCPASTSNIGQSSTTLDPAWRNVCCAYNINTDSCCLLDPSKPITGLKFSACDGFSF